MNWYKQRKLAAPPLPEAEFMPINVDTGRQGGISRIDRKLTEEQAKEQEQQHPNLEFLGAGNWGVAYLPGSKSNIVVKYTNDRQEYLNARKILELQKNIGGSLPGVVTVYHTEEISRNSDIYKIWLEKVMPVSGYEEDILDKSLWIIRLSNEELSDRNNQSLLEESGLLFTKENENIINKMRKFTESINVNNFYGDMHPRNIGIDSNGDYVILDLGGIF